MLTVDIKSVQQILQMKATFILKKIKNRLLYIDIYIFNKNVVFSHLRIREIL